MPPYSSDFNPIEMALSKLKAHPRRAAERTRDGLWDRIGRLIVQVVPAEAPTSSPLLDTSQIGRKTL